MRRRHPFSSGLISSSSTSREWISWKSRLTQGYTPHDFKQRLLAQFPDMQAHNKARDVLKVFEKDVGAALARARGLDSDAVHLACAAPYVSRRQVFQWIPKRILRGICSFTCTRPGEHDSRLDGPSIKDQMAYTNPAAFAVAQILKFNCIKPK